MRDPELVARAERGARRLESAWEKWRAQHGLAVAPGQPIVSYVGYSLTEPWGEPRVVIGIDADEAEYLADFLDREDGAHLQLPRQQAALAGASAEAGGEYTATALVAAPVPVGIGLQPQSQDQVRDMGTELPGWSPGELADQAAWPQGERAEQAARSPGERAEQAAEQLAGWQGGPATADQPSVIT